MLRAGKHQQSYILTRAFVQSRQRDKSTETDHGEKTDCENGRLANNTVIMLACSITIDWKTRTIPIFSKGNSFGGIG